MNKKLKETLKHLFATQKINNGWTSFSEKECKELSNYITNLEKENKRLNNIINELEKWLNELKEPIIIEGKYKNWKKINLSVDIQQVLDKLKELKENK